MSLSDLKNLKELSWFLTVPLFVCALILDNSEAVIQEMKTILGFFLIVGECFLHVVVGLGVVAVVYFFSSLYLEQEHDLPFTLVVATFMLTFSAVGIMGHFFTPPELDVPINIFWFFGMAALSFNFYQLKSNAL